MGFFAGTIVNRIGVRLALSFGGIGYSLYSISLLVSEHYYVPGFNIFAGAFLGVCAGVLWAAQGTIMMSYPLEKQKGRYFAWFWAIFNVGACMGSLVRPLLLCNILFCATLTRPDYSGREYPRQREQNRRRWNLHCFHCAHVCRRLFGAVHMRRG